MSELDDIINQDLSKEQVQFLILKFMLLEEAKKAPIEYRKGFLAGLKLAKLEGKLFKEV